MVRVILGLSDFKLQIILNVLTFGQGRRRVRAPQAAHLKP